jgi:hypothetical protein
MMGLGGESWRRKMKWLGHISYRDGGDVWYAEKIEGHDVWGWCLDKASAKTDITPEEAEVIVARLEASGHNLVQYKSELK